MEGFGCQFELQPRPDLHGLLDAALNPELAGSAFGTSLLDSIVRTPGVQEWLEQDGPMMSRVARRLVLADNDETAILGGVLSLYVSHDAQDSAIEIFHDLAAKSRDLAIEAATDIDGRVDEEVRLRGVTPRSESFFQYRAMINRLYF